MATEFHYFTGKCKWAMLKKPDEKYNNWKIDLYLDDDQIDKLNAIGLQNSQKEDADGKFYTFRRPTEFQTRDKTTRQLKIIPLNPPLILAKDKKTPMDVLIGNGSTVTMKLEVYDTQKGKGSRMIGVVVEDLVPFEGNGEMRDSTSLPF